MMTSQAGARELMTSQQRELMTSELGTRHSGSGVPRNFVPETRHGTAYRSRLNANLHKVNLEDPGVHDKGPDNGIGDETSNAPGNGPSNGPNEPGNSHMNPSNQDKTLSKSEIAFPLGNQNKELNKEYITKDDHPSNRAHGNQDDTPDDNTAKRSVPVEDPLLEERLLRGEDSPGRVAFSPGGGAGGAPGDAPLCPRACSCQGTARPRVDCSDRNLTTVPTDLSATTTHL